MSHPIPPTHDSSVQPSPRAANSDTTAPKKVIGRPFQAGQPSANPSGRPKATAEFRQRCKDFMDSEGWDKLVALAQGNTRDAMRALELVAGYSYGKPTQPLAGDSSMDPLEIIISRRGNPEASTSPQD